MQRNDQYLSKKEFPTWARYTQVAKGVREDEF
jgi:hypothetical protein